MLLLEKITCPRCSKEYEDIEDILKVCNIRCNARFCKCGCKFTWTRHTVVKALSFIEHITSNYYEIKELDGKK